MKRIGASEARRHLPRLLDRVAQGDSLAVSRHGKPVARLVPIPHDRGRAREATARIIERRRFIKRVPLADLMATIREGHCL